MLEISAYCTHKLGEFSELEQKITRAWSKVLIPPAYSALGVSTDSPDEFGVLFRKYGNKHWGQIVDEDISGYCGSISLMVSNEGKAYYVSSHLVKFLRLMKSLATLSNEAQISRALDEAVMNLDHVLSAIQSVCALEGGGEAFTSAQVTAIREFFNSIEGGFEDHTAEFKQLKF